MFEFVYFKVAILFYFGLLGVNFTVSRQYVADVYILDRQWSVPRANDATRVHVDASVRVLEHTGAIQGMQQAHRSHGVSQSRS